MVYVSHPLFSMRDFRLTHCFPTRFSDRPVYNAYAKEYSFFYCNQSTFSSLSCPPVQSVLTPKPPSSDMFFLFAGFHIAFCTYMFIGIPSSGSGGLINLISRFASGSIVAGVFCILATVGWALEGLASLWMYKNVSLLCRSTEWNGTDVDF